MKAVNAQVRRASPVADGPTAPTTAQETPAIRYDDELPPSVKVVPTIFPASPPLEQCLDGFWDLGADFQEVVIAIEPPDKPLAVLEKLGPSPFERGGFPLVGFLATTYEKVGRYALERK